ncbi:SDR family oxidoreductase [Actinomadura sp. GC306]|nr:SDR family oxidoreductase [Actinomadura sp. GC306]
MGRGDRREPAVGVPAVGARRAVPARPRARRRLPRARGPERLRRDQGGRRGAQPRDRRRTGRSRHPRQLRRAGQRGRRRAARGRPPSGRTTAPEEVADATLYLASPAAAQLNGHVLRVDGGLHARLRAGPSRGQDRGG